MGLNDYFKEKTENLSFIELKDNSYVQINDYKIDSSLPLPILIDTLIDEVKSGDMKDDIKVSYLIEGIIYTLGVDPEFEYVDQYKDILFAYSTKIDNYIFHIGMKYMIKEKIEEAMIYFRALLVIDKTNVEALFNYGICLENKAKEFLNSGNEEKGNMFLREAMENIETILDISPKYSLAYYKLGYYYRYYGQFLKARLIWEKFLLLDEDKERKQEIREVLDAIEDDSNYEEGCNLLFSGRYSEAIEMFINIKDRYEDWWNLNYMLGLSYKGIGEIDKAIKYFMAALELNENEVNIYNELGICLFSIGNFEDAIEIFTKGIKKDNKDYKIICNRGIAYLQLGMLKEAINDIDKAYEINPYDEVVKKFKKELEIGI